MKILYVSQYFPPEIAAPAARVAELSRSWAAEGHEVSVVTGFPNHPTGQIPPEYRWKFRRFLMRDDRDGVKVYRTWLIPLPNRRSWERICNYASFALSAAFRGVFLTRSDVVIATSPQLLVGLSGLFIAKCRRIPFVFEVRDLWPESLEAVGVSRKKSLLVWALGKVSGLLYRKATRIVVVTYSFKAHLEKVWRVPSSKISVIMNGVDHELFRPEEAKEEIIREFHLKNRFIIAYIGTIGNAHGLETLVSVAEMLAVADPNVLLLVVGEGAEKESFQRTIEKKNLQNIRVLPAQPRAKIPALLAASHICLVLLKKSELFKTVLPTKMLEYMSSGRPIISTVQGESAALLEEANAGICVEPERPDVLYHAICQLRTDSALRERLGNNGRSFIVSRLTRERTAARYLALLERT